MISCRNYRSDIHSLKDSKDSETDPLKMVTDLLFI